MARIVIMDALRSIHADLDAPPTRPAPAKFARCDRKDARLRPDQSASLAELAETVMGRRRVKVERITENTLIRVAIDLLLTRAGDLSGSTEDELRKSVTTASEEHTHYPTPMEGTRS